MENGKWKMINIWILSARNLSFSIFHLPFFIFLLEDFSEDSKKVCSRQRPAGIPQALQVLRPIEVVPVRKHGDPEFKRLEDLESAPQHIGRAPLDSHEKFPNESRGANQIIASI